MSVGAKIYLFGFILVITQNKVKRKGSLTIVSETINESVSVNILSNHLKKSAGPTAIFWHGRRYTITAIGLHYTVREGRTLFHVFSVTDGVSCFKLRLDTETLFWRLLEIEG